MKQIENENKIKIGLFCLRNEYKRKEKNTRNVSIESIQNMIFSINSLNPKFVTEKITLNKLYESYIWTGEMEKLSTFFQETSEKNTKTRKFTINFMVDVNYTCKDKKKNTQFSYEYQGFDRCKLKLITKISLILINGERLQVHLFNDHDDLSLNFEEYPCLQEIDLSSKNERVEYIRNLLKKVITKLNEHSIIHNEFNNPNNITESENLNCGEKIFQFLQTYDELNFLWINQKRLLGKIEDNDLELNIICFLHTVLTIFKDVFVFESGYLTFSLILYLEEKSKEYSNSQLQLNYLIQIYKKFSLLNSKLLKRKFTKFFKIKLIENLSFSDDKDIQKFLILSKELKLYFTQLDFDVDIVYALKRHVNFALDKYELFLTVQNENTDRQENLKVELISNIILNKTDIENIYLNNLSKLNRHMIYISDKVDFDDTCKNSGKEIISKDKESNIFYFNEKKENDSAYYKKVIDEAKIHLKTILNHVKFGDDLFNFFSLIYSDVEIDINGKPAFIFDTQKDKRIIWNKIFNEFLRIFIIVSNCKPDNYEMFQSLKSFSGKKINKKDDGDFKAFYESGLLSAIFINKDSLSGDNNEKIDIVILILLFLHEICHYVRFNYGSEKDIFKPSPLVLLSGEINKKQSEIGNLIEVLIAGKLFDEVLKIKKSTNYDDLFKIFINPDSWKNNLSILTKAMKDLTSNKKQISSSKNYYDDGFVSNFSSNLPYKNNKKQNFKKKSILVDKYTKKKRGRNKEEREIENKKEYNTKADNNNNISKSYRKKKSVRMFESYSDKSIEKFKYILDGSFNEMDEKLPYSIKNEKNRSNLSESDDLEIAEYNREQYVEDLKRKKKIDLKEYESIFDIDKTVEKLIEIGYDPRREYSDEDIEILKERITLVDLPYKRFKCGTLYELKIKTQSILKEMIL